jgi:hypothetical protein
MPSIKHQLFLLCQAFIEARIASATQAIQLAQASANEETKSSAGDKYETGRAMAQLEIENNTKQLVEARRLKQSLEQIEPVQENTRIQLGSVVYTSQANYFIAISAGKFIVDGVTFYAVSPASPVGMKLMNLGPGSSVTLNERIVLVDRVI